MGQAGRAIAAAQRAIDLSPNFALGRLLLGLARLQAGRAGQAIEPLQRGLRLNPHDPQAFTWLQFLAIAHFLRGDHEEAARRVADAVAKRPEAPLGHCILACSLAELGRREEAREALAELQQRTLAGTDGPDILLRRFVGRADRDRILEALHRIEGCQ